MIIDINKMEYERMDNFKGGEKYINGKMYFDGVNRVLVATIIPGASIGLHKHETNSEVIFIEEGSPLVIFEGKEERMEKGNVHYCKKGFTHTLINDTDKDVKIRAVIFEQ